MSLRILHISTRMILGGSQENTVLSCEGQARLGHEVHLAYGPVYGPEGSLVDRVHGFRTQDGRTIATHVVPDLIREVHPLRDARCLSQLDALIARIRPDVVHTHSSKAGVLGRAAAWRATPRPGVVHTVHGPPFMPVEGSSLQRAKVRIVNSIYERAERFAAARCHVIVVVAEAMTRTFLMRGIGVPSQYTLVRSGMDVEPMLHAEPGEDRASVRAGLGVGETDFVVGIVARLAQHKGHDDALSALADEVRARPSWRMLWVGDGWWRERLVERARSMGLRVRELDREGPPPRDGSPPAQLILTGLVPPQRVPGLLRAMDVLAHPSSREGLPRTVPQALLAGACPVASDADGTREACIEMETGRLVPVGDVAKLREAVVWCAEHPAERAALVARGREMALRAFSTRAMVEGLEAVYRRAIDAAKMGAEPFPR